MQWQRRFSPWPQESGKIDLGPYAVIWTSATIMPIIDRPGSLFQIALYNMDVRVEDQPGSVLANFALRQIGYQRVHDPGLILGDQGARLGDPTRSQ